MDREKYKAKLDQMFQREKNTTMDRTIIDLKEMYYSKKLASLILMNPELPVVPVFQGKGKMDYAWFTCSYDEPYVGEYWEDLWGRILHIKVPEEISFMFGLEERLDAINDYYSGNISLSSIDDQELMEKYEGINWSKAIILPIWHMGRDPYGF